jgi:serine/threonine protein kinase
MYEMLTGKRPFLSPELSAILYNVVNLTPPSANDVRSEVPEGVARIIARLMEKRPEDRFASAEDALEELSAIREARRVRTVPVSGNETITTPIDRTPPLPTVVDRATAPSTPALHRKIPTPLFWFVPLTLLALLATASLLTLEHARTVEVPTGEITPEQAQTAAAKLRDLTSLRALTAVGKYEEAIAGYDAFIARHPESSVARTERDEAQKALEARLPHPGPR